MARPWVAAVAGLLLAGTAHAQAHKEATGTINWQPRFVNPAAATGGDLTLPMPCGGGMVFRPVEIPTGPGLLEDRMVVLGAADVGADDYLEFVRPTSIAGSFGPATKRFYYLAKYELTINQAKALTASGEHPCAALTMEGQVPQTGLNWYEANDLAYRYNQWLFTHAREALPIAGTARGFIRLPTEAEWEYAARGGTAVSETQFREPLFPMDKDIVEYAWFQGTRSAANKLHPVGKLLPNPLGFYDIIGNAGEIILDPFRLNRVGRLHGGTGAFIVKGGDFRTDQRQLRSSRRVEVPHFDSERGGPNRQVTTGVRFAIGVLAVTSLEQVRSLQESFQSLATSADKLPDDPQELVKGMIRDAVDPELNRKLKLIATKLAEGVRAAKEFEARAVGSSLRSAAILVLRIRDLNARIKMVDKAIANRKVYERESDPDAAKSVKEWSEYKRAWAEQLATSLDTYAHLVVVASDDYPKDVVGTEAQIVIDELTAQSLTSYPPFVGLFVKHVDQYRRSQALDSQRWLQEMLSQQLR